MLPAQPSHEPSVPASHGPHNTSSHFSVCSSDQIAARSIGRSTIGRSTNPLNRSLHHRPLQLYWSFFTRPSLIYSRAVPPLTLLLHHCRLRYHRARATDARDNDACSTDAHSTTASSNTAAALGSVQHSTQTAACYTVARTAICATAARTSLPPLCREPAGAVVDLC